MRSEFAVFYLDDGTLGGNSEDVIYVIKNIEVEVEALCIHRTKGLKSRLEISGQKPAHL